MKCKDCHHFKIICNPIKHGTEIWDFGRAKCEKYDLIVDFANKRKLNKLECLEKSSVWGAVVRVEKNEFIRKDEAIRAVIGCVINGYDVSFATDAIKEIHGIEAVPLDPLCDWLSKNYEPPYGEGDYPTYPINYERHKEIWKRFLTKWMEGLDGKQEVL